MGIGRALWAACASALVAGSAQAATQWRLTPSATIAVGGDDNVLFNNTGGDQVARGQGRLSVRAYERLWHVTGDLSLGGLGYNERNKFVWLGETTWHAGSRISRETRVDALARVRAADDPLALAQVGLLAGQGRTLGYRTSLSFEHRLDRSWRAGTTFRYDGVRFLDNSTQKDGDAVGIAAFARYRFSRALMFQGPVEERIFLQEGGVLGTSSAVVPGVRWRAMRRTFLEAAVGPLAFLDTQGAVWLPVARLKFEHQWRWAAVDVTASNDLTVPAGRGGVLYGQLLEGVGRYGSPDWEIRGRAGYYRSHPSPRDDRWVPGYGLELGAFRRLVGPMWLGLTALRFERLESSFEPAMARDAIYIRLDFTGERP